MRRAALPDGPSGAARRVIAAIVAACSVTISLLAVGAPSAAAPSTPVPACPPDCGSVAAGDPLLMQYLTPNPGVGWLALPSADVQSYVDALKLNLRTRAGTGVGVNAVAGRWEWVSGRYGLLIVLVSSASLSKLHLGSPARNAGDLCAASRGEPRSQLVPIPGVPGSVSGLCALPSRSSAQGATVIAFNRANVATLIEITSKSSTSIDQREADLVAQGQYQTLPPGGVLVSDGFDLELVVFWICLLTAIVIGAVACVRRRRHGRGPLDAVIEAFGHRKLALGVSLLAVIGAMAFSMLDSSLLHGSGQWFESSYNDFWRNWADSAYLTFGGGYGHLYMLDRTLETAPAVQVLMAPIARLAFGLSFPDPNTVLYPQAYWVAGPLLLALMALPICAGDRWLERMGVSDAPRRLAVLGTMAVTLPPIALYGHAEDLVALGAMLYGLMAAQEGRSRAAGYWIGAAIAFQLFAVLAIPIALVLMKRREWLGAIVPMALIPLAFLIVPLFGDFERDSPSTGPPAGLRRSGVHHPDVESGPRRGRLRTRPHCPGGGSRRAAAPTSPPGESRSGRQHGGLDGGGALLAAGVRAGAGAVLPGTDSGPAAAERRETELVAPHRGVPGGGVVELVAPRRRRRQMVSLAAPHRSDRGALLAGLADGPPPSTRRSPQSVPRQETCARSLSVLRRLQTACSPSATDPGSAPDQSRASGFV